MKKLGLIILSLFTFLSFNAQTQLSAEQILAKAVALCSNNKGLSSRFKISNSGYTGNGDLKAVGSKFSIIMPDVEIWFNGTDMYTYNKSSKETTVVTPTPEELSESNPLNYITSARKNYNVKFSTVKKNGKYVLELTPKLKNENIKRVTLTLNKGNFVPEKIVVEPLKGQPIAADILDFKTGISLPQSLFEYPQKKYPKVEIVDLR